MRKLRTALLAGAGALFVAGAAVAAEKYHTMNVALRTARSRRSSIRATSRPRSSLPMRLFSA